MAEGDSKVVDESSPLVVTNEEQIQTGAYVQGVVKRIEFNRIVVQILDREATLQFGQAEPAAEDQTMAGEDFPEGRDVNVWIRHINKKGNLQLTMKNPSK